MVKSRLLGFDALTIVEIEARAGAQTVRETLDNWTIDPEGHVGLEITAPETLVAPTAVQVRVDALNMSIPAPVAPVIHDPRSAGLDYIADLGNPGATWSKPINVRPEWRDANVRSGDSYAANYQAAGSYTITQTVTDITRARAFQATHDLDVLDPDLVFAGTATIYVHPTADYSLAPLGARTATTFDQAWNMLSATELNRIMLAPGVVHEIDRVYITDENQRNFYVAPPTDDTHGLGRPEIRYIGPAGVGAVLRAGWGVSEAPQRRDFTMTGLILTGLFDPVTGEGGMVTGVELVANADRVGSLIIDDCVFQGFHTGIFLGWTADPPVIAINDCDLDCAAAYTIFGGGRNLHVTGALLARNAATALTGGDKGLEVRNHFFRLTGMSNTSLRCVDGAPYLGWVINHRGPVGAHTVEYHTQQPFLRAGTNGNEGEKLNMSCCSAQGGYDIVSVSSQNTTTKGGAGTFVVEDCYLLGGHMTRSWVFSNRGGLTVRNTVAIAADVPRVDAFYDPRLFGEFRSPVGELTPANGENYNIALRSLDAPLRYYNNTFINLMTAANYGDPNRTHNWGILDVAATAGFTDVAEENSVYHGYDQNGPITADGPFDMTPVPGWTSRYAGYRSHKSTSETALPADLADGADVLLPFPGTFTADDFGPDTLGMNKLSLDGAEEEEDGTFTLAIEPGGVRLTNQSGGTWSAGSIARISLDHRESVNGLPPRLTQYATPPLAFISGQPLAGSPVLGSATPGLVAYRDITGAIRGPNPSRGAFQDPA